MAMKGFTSNLLTVYKQVLTLLNSVPKPVAVIIFSCLTPVVALGIYTLVVIFRVSIEEQKYFGKSTLLPVSLHNFAYNQTGTVNTFGSSFYTYIRPNGQSLNVHKQLINGFQHAYGSALVAFEMGEQFSDFLFRANEYAESYIFCRKTCGALDYALDTRKDLANNSVGRSIAVEAKRMGLKGSAAYHFILTKTLEDSDIGLIYPHLKDPRVAKLPSEEQYGCFGLYLTNPKLY